MNGRSSVSLLALTTLVMAAFAGCLDAPSFLTESDVEATARENKDLADGAAAAWSGDAKLVGISAFEASPAHAMASMGKAPADPTIGNGRALVWLYAYQTPDDSRVFRVDADGRIQVENTTMVPAAEIPKGEPLGAFSVDSDAAMKVARADPTFDAAAAAANASVVSALGTESGAAKWALVAIGDKVVVAVVDANTAELLLVQTVDTSSYALPAMPGYADVVPEVIHIEESGSLGASEDVAEFPFTYNGRGDPALMEINVVRYLPTDRLYWAIMDEDGEEVAYGYGSGLISYGGTYETDFELENPGDYTLVLHYNSLVPLSPGGVDYAFTLHVGPMPDEDQDEDEDDL